MTRAELHDLVDANLLDNNSGLITPAKLRQVIDAVIDNLATTSIAGHYGGVAPTDPPTDQTVYTTAFDLDEPHDTWHWNPETLTWI